MSPPTVVQNLVHAIPVLQSILNELIEDWRPEPLPITVCLGDLGRALVEHNDIPPEQVSQVFERVEATLRDGTESEKDAIATGFLEAVVTATDKEPPSRWVLAHAGPEARAYILAWNKFCG